jgi:hypothetical protein
MKEKVEALSYEEIRAILRAADEIIGRGGRTLLAKILKGSKEKKVLALELDQCPMYGFYRNEKLDDIICKIDWMIEHDFLDTELFGKLAMIVFTERGWLIEEDQYVDELLKEWDLWLEQGRTNLDMSYLKDRNRRMIHLLLKKVKETQNIKYIPLLESWEKVDYKKVREEIRATIQALESNQPIIVEEIQQREALLSQALQGSATQDLLIKCWDCGNRFTYSAGEQKFFKQKGYTRPKRCPKCRDKKV